ncbi:hypothetical protein FACS1894158_18750 [Betaproteobacteria bacterium]|nr:hypothetical protein FACS1894158_18750 [Betaproteobacteria bacterium]
MRRGLTILASLVFVALLGACHERAARYWPSSYSEAKEARKNRKPLSPEQLEKVYGECPKPNGIFRNEADVKNVSQLEDYFLVEGFDIPATSFPGGREDDESLSASATPVNLLGGEKNGVRQDYYHQRYYEHRTLQERFTLELRPLGLGRFHIGVTSSLTGRSAESDRGWINSLGGQVHCENGVLKGFWKKYDKTVLGWEFFVDEESGDIVVHSPLPPERYYRFKRIGK